MKLDKLYKRITLHHLHIWKRKKIHACRACMVGSTNEGTSIYYVFMAGPFNLPGSTEKLLLWAAIYPSS